MTVINNILSNVDTQFHASLFKYSGNYKIIFVNFNF